MKKCFALLLVIMLMSMSALADSPELTVHGTGIVGMEPDIATIIFGARERATEVSQAQSRVNEHLNASIEALKEMGISEENIHTNGLYIYQDYSEGEDVFYVAENTISVDIRDIENVGKYIDAVFEAGANTFNDLSFSVSNSADERQRALELAVEDARKKAEVLAAAAGMKLGKIESLQEDNTSVGGNYYTSNDGMYARGKESVASAPTMVLADQVQVYASVTIEFELEPLNE